MAHAIWQALADAGLGESWVVTDSHIELQELAAWYPSDTWEPK